MTRDIVERLRDRAYSSKVPDPLLEEAADEIVSLRNGALSARETVTLTDEEQEAVRYMIAAAKFGQRDDELTEEHAATLRGLLERMK